MKRDFQRLKTGPFDLLVIGGGIYGAWIAYDAALRGVRVALVERADWASGASSGSSKLIHGGLRYLEHAHFGLVRKSLRERRRLLQLAPHRVKLLRFLFPVYSGARVGRFRLRMGFRLYDLLAGRRRVGPRHRVLTARGMRRRFDFLNHSGLQGGFTYSDAQTDDARFTLEIVDGAIHAGAVAVNYAKATELLTEGSRVVGARIEDVETPQTVDLRASVTVNCAGAWSAELNPGEAGATPAVRVTKGVHLVLPRLPTEYALIVPSDADRRVVFMMPWYGRTLLGTTDTDHDGDPDTARVEQRDFDYLLGIANRVLTDAPWTESDVIASFVGLRALAPTSDGSPSSVSREWSIERTAEGLLTSVGGKFTSARADAAVAVERVMKMLNRRPGQTPTEDRPLPWRPQGRFRSWRREGLLRAMDLGLDEETALTCLARYGGRVDNLFDLIEELPELARRIVADAPFCRGEILFAPREEMARTLGDVLRRRIPVLLIARLPERTIEWAARMVGSVLKWSEERKRTEVAQVVEERRIPS